MTPSSSGLASMMPAVVVQMTRSMTRIVLGERCSEQGIATALPRANTPQNSDQRDAGRSTRGVSPGMDDVRLGSSWHMQAGRLVSCCPTAAGRPCLPALGCVAGAGVVTAVRAKAVGKRAAMSTHVMSAPCAAVNESASTV